MVGDMFRIKTDGKKYADDIIIVTNNSKSIMCYCYINLEGQPKYQRSKKLFDKHFIPVDRLTRIFYGA